MMSGGTRKRNRGSLNFVFGNIKGEEKENKIEVDSDDDFVVENKVDILYSENKKPRKLKKMSASCISEPKIETPPEPIIEVGCNQEKKLSSDNLPLKEESLPSPIPSPRKEKLEENINKNNVVQKIASAAIQSLELHLRSPPRPNNLVGTLFTTADLESEKQLKGSDMLDQNPKIPDKSLPIITIMQSTSTDLNRNENLTRHLLPSDDDPINVIGTYDEMLTNLINTSLKEVEKMTGSKKSRWHCLCCSKIWVVTKKTATRHMETHLPPRQCQLCIRTFNTKEKLLVHIKSVHNNNVTGLITTLTSNTFKPVEVFEEHGKFDASSKDQIDSARIHPFTIPSFPPSSPAQLNTPGSSRLSTPSELGSVRPGIPRPPFRQGESRPIYRPGASRPIYRPGTPRPTFRPGESRPIYRPDKPRPIYRPGAPRPSYRPGAPMTTCSSRAPRPLYSTGVPGLLKQGALGPLKPGAPSPLKSVPPILTEFSLKVSNVRTLPESAKQAITPAVVDLCESSPPSQQDQTFASADILNKFTSQGVTVMSNIHTTNTEQSWAPPPGLSVVRSCSSRKDNHPLTLSKLSSAFHLLGVREGRKRIVRFELTEEQIKGLELLGVRETEV